MKTSIVTTTINLPRFLEAYVPNLQHYGHKDVNIIIVGDTKTPKETEEYVAFHAGDISVEFWDVKKQEEWFNENYPTLKEEIAFAIPYQSIRRRNFGYLRALQLKSDVIITIDDDNYPTGDWLKEHLDAFSAQMPIVMSPNRLVNPCEVLNCNHYPIYMRGYPISEIFNDEFIQSTENKNRIVLNMGLWTNKPDVDSYTNIIYPDLKSEGQTQGKRFACKTGHYIPVNTQNTAFLKEVMPAFYLLFQDSSIYENKIDRFDDIWSGFILQKIAHALGDTISFGAPLADHQRNTHDFNKDLKIEFSGICMNQKIFNFIRDYPLECESYTDGYKKITNAFESFLFSNHQEVSVYYMRMIKAMRIWPLLVERWL